MFISAYAKVGGLVWVPRMLEKIRRHAAGGLPADYVPYLGKGFDKRCALFLGVDYGALTARVLEGGTDEEILAWCFVTGRQPSENEILVWNEYMIKRGWRDTDRAPNDLQEYKDKYGMGHRTDILTYFDFYEVDEGRRP